MSEIEDRRQRAREAFYDGMGAGDVIESHAVEAAIEVTTQVKITPEAVEAAWDAQPIAAQQAAEIDLDDMRHVVAAALAVLGFEVVEIE